MDGWGEFNCFAKNQPANGRRKIEESRNEDRTPKDGEWNEERNFQVAKYTSGGKRTASYHRSDTGKDSGKRNPTLTGKKTGMLMKKGADRFTRQKTHRNKILY